MFTLSSADLHLAERKSTEKTPIEVVPSPRRIYLHFSQHAGNPAIPLVAKGTHVKIGTKIGEADGLISAPIHSSIAGKVIDIIAHPHPTLGSARCCVIESTDNEEWEMSIKDDQPYEGLDRAELLHLIKEAGIVGLGGGAFPTHVKLEPPPEKQIETLIINGCESEPMLTNDHRLMIEFPVGIIEGAKIFQKILNCKQLIFAVGKNKKDAIQKFKSEGAKVHIMSNRYPQGAEKMLIKTLLKREVPRNGLPQDVGCVVQNIATCYAAFQAVKFRKPLIDRVITVTGDGVKSSKNLLVRIGTSAIDVINFCGGYTKPPRMMIFGGPMTGIAQYSEQVPIVKSTLGIIVRSESSIEEEKPCVRCAHCVDVCPMRLMPVEIHRFVKQKAFAKAQAYGVLDCIECGSCAYTCPAKIPLVHYFKYGKFELNQIAKV